MKKGLTVFLMSLIFIVAACDQLPEKQYNKDGNEAYPITFAYPFTWEVIEDNFGVNLFLDASEIKVEKNGNLSGFFAGTVGIGFTSQFDEVSDINDNLITPLEALQNREAQYDEQWQKYHEPKSEVSNSDGGLVSALDSPAIGLVEVYESPRVYEICDQEVVGMKSQVYFPFFGVMSPHRRAFDFMVTIDGTPIYVVGYFGDIEEEKFEEIFESVICSLELHD